MYSGVDTLKIMQEKILIRKQAQSKKNILSSTALKANEPSLMQMTSNLFQLVQLQNVLHQKQEQLANLLVNQYCQTLLSVTKTETAAGHLNWVQQHLPNCVVLYHF